MARKPETTASNRINNKLIDVYFEKMNNPYRGGTPDFYYEGFVNSMWVEYKWYDTKPKQWNLTNPKDPKISKLQQNWLRRAHNNRQLTAVIVGYPNGYSIFEGLSWEDNLPSREDITAQDVAKWIAFQVA